MPRPKSTGLSPAQTEQSRINALLNTAAEVFLEQGYEAASTAEIARRAGASKQTFYARFPTKEKLFLAVINHRTSKLPERFPLLFEQTWPVRDGLSAIANVLLYEILSPEHVALSRIVYMEATRFPEAARYLVERGPDRVRFSVANYLRKQDELGLLQVEDPLLASTQFSALVVGDLFHRALLGVNQHKQRRALAARVASSVEAFLRIYAHS